VLESWHGEGNNTLPCIGASRSATLWGPRKCQSPKSEARRAERGGVLGRGCSPPQQLGGLRSAVSSRSRVQGKTPATWRFRTFCRLAKPHLVSSLVILHLFQWNFHGVRAIEDPTTKFLCSLCFHEELSCAQRKDESWSLVVDSVLCCFSALTLMVGWQEGHRACEKPVPLNCEGSLLESMGSFLGQLEEEIGEVTS